MLRELIHFVRVLPTARRLQSSMSFVDCHEVLERDLDDAGKREFRASLVTDLQGLRSRLAWARV
jgi:hypothetical protein